MTHPHLLVLAALKGAIEKQDPGYYFGSTICLSFHVEEAKDLGLMDGSEATARGREIYAELGLAAVGPVGRRAYLWDWTAVPPIPGTAPPKAARALHKKKA